jgi:transcriptional regulator with GAF, ATPase, and Fis domain
VLDEEILRGRARAETVRLRTENAELRAALDRSKGGRKIVGNDPSLQRVFDTIAAVAPTRATVLVTGESGTGKSLVAKMVHEASPRRAGPFVEMNCGALPEGLLESELFGHTKGAFTGAAGARIGRFLAADHGTMFSAGRDQHPALQLKPCASSGAQVRPG